MIQEVDRIQSIWNSFTFSTGTIDNSLLSAQKFLKDQKLPSEYVYKLSNILTTTQILFNIGQNLKN